METIKPVIAPLTNRPLKTKVKVWNMFLLRTAITSIVYEQEFKNPSSECFKIVLVSFEVRSAYQL